MSDNLAVSISFSVGWALASGINALSYLYIKNTRDTSKAVYFGSLFEAGSMAVACLAACLLNIYVSIVGGCSGALCCTLLILLQVIPQIQAFVRFWISLIRLKRYLNTDLELADQIWFDDAELIKYFKWFFAIGMAFKVIYNVGLMNVTDGVAACPTDGLFNDFSLPPIILAWTVIAPILASAFMDVYSFYLSKTKELNTEIPLRSTIISSALTSIDLAFVIIVQTGTSLPTIKTSVPILLIILSLFGMPISIAFGLPKVNQVNVAPDDPEEERKRNQQMEENLAIQKRNERRQANEAKRQQEQIELDDLRDKLKNGPLPCHLPDPEKDQGGIGNEVVARVDVHLENMPNVPDVGMEQQEKVRLGKITQGFVDGTKTMKRKRPRSA